MIKAPQSHDIVYFTCRTIASLILGATILLMVTCASAFGQSTPDSNIRISQIYTRGGEAGAIYQSDFIEIFNRGNSTVDINCWTLNISTFEGSRQETRATVLRKIAEHPAFIAAEFNRAFVLMQYFGYLRRNPDDPPNNNFDGFDFWLAAGPIQGLPARGDGQSLHQFH
jgi:hypothetical protein